MASQGHSRAHFWQLEQKILQSEVNGFIGNQRQIGGHDDCFKTRADKRVEHQFADTAEFPRPAHITRGICSTWESALVCGRAG